MDETSEKNDDLEEYGSWMKSSEEVPDSTEFPNFEFIDENSGTPEPEKKQKAELRGFDENEEITDDDFISGKDFAGLADIVDGIETEIKVEDPEKSSGTAPDASAFEDTDIPDTAIIGEDIFNETKNGDEIPEETEEEFTLDKFDIEDLVEKTPPNPRRFETAEKCAVEEFSLDELMLTEIPEKEAEDETAVEEEDPETSGDYEFNEEDSENNLGLEVEDQWVPLANDEMSLDQFLYGREEEKEGPYTFDEPVVDAELEDRIGKEELASDEFVSLSDFLEGEDSEINSPGEVSLKSDIPEEETVKESYKFDEQDATPDAIPQEDGEIDISAFMDDSSQAPGASGDGEIDISAFMGDGGDNFKPDGEVDLSEFLGDSGSGGGDFGSVDLSSFMDGESFSREKEEQAEIEDQEPLDIEIEFEDVEVTAEEGSSSIDNFDEIEFPDADENDAPVVHKAEIQETQEIDFDDLFDNIVDETPVVTGEPEPEPSAAPKIQIDAGPSEEIDLSDFGFMDNPENQNPLLSDDKDVNHKKAGPVDYNFMIDEDDEVGKAKMEGTYVEPEPEPQTDAEKPDPQDEDSVDITKETAEEKIPEQKRELPSQDFDLSSILSSIKDENGDGISLDALIAEANGTPAQETAGDTVEEDEPETSAETTESENESVAGTENIENLKEFSQDVFDNIEETTDNRDICDVIESGDEMSTNEDLSVDDFMGEEGFTDGGIGVTGPYNEDGTPIEKYMKKDEEEPKEEIQEESLEEENPGMPDISEILGDVSPYEEEAESVGITMDDLERLSENPVYAPEMPVEKFPEVPDYDKYDGEKKEYSVFVKSEFGEKEAVEEESMASEDSQEQMDMQQAHESQSTEVDMQTKILQQIAGELASLKSEISTLKSEINEIRNGQTARKDESPEPVVEESVSDDAENESSEEDVVFDEPVVEETAEESPAEQTAEEQAADEISDEDLPDEELSEDVQLPYSVDTGFFEENEEEDDTIALSGDELSNILNTVELVESTGFDEEEPDAGFEEPVFDEDQASDDEEDISVPSSDDDILVDSSSTDLMDDSVTSDSEVSEVEEFAETEDLEEEEQDTESKEPVADVFNSWDSAEETEAPVENEDFEEPVCAEPDAEEPAEDESPAPAESVSEEIPQNMKEEIKAVLAYMDQLLENLPEEKITEFAQSEHFETYKKLFAELGLS